MTHQSDFNFLLSKVPPKGEEQRVHSEYLGAVVCENCKPRSWKAFGAIQVSLEHQLTLKLPAWPNLQGWSNLEE